MDGSFHTTTSTSDDGGMKIVLSIFWVISVVVALFIGYGIGQGQAPDQNVLQANTSQIAPTPTQGPQQIVPPADYAVPDTANNAPPAAPANTTACVKTGFAQKWEYLTAYEVKQNETLQSIATEQLKDSSRVNEILQINGVGPLVVGYTLYLPPSTITKSSGNIKQVYGKLIEKNSSSWHLSFSSDPKGQGIIIPSFWFENIANRDSFKTGDCLKIFFDDGFTVYSVSLQ